MTTELARLLVEIRSVYTPEIASGAIWHFGTFNCRRKNNTANGPWSEHAWPNAVDIMLTTGPSRKPLGDRIAAWAHARPDLVSETFWWVTFHYDHVHLTAAPRRNFDNKQVPPCAGGPPIMEDEMITTWLTEPGWRSLYQMGIVLGSSETAVVQYWVVEAAQRTPAEHREASTNIFVKLAEKAVQGGGLTTDQVLSVIVQRLS